MTKQVENNLQGMANIADYRHPLYTVCGFSNDYYYYNPKKCKHKTRLYTAPNEKGKQFMKATIKGFEKGRYTEENREWLKQNVGKTYECEKHNINYVRFSNGFLCHIYECYCA